MAKPSTLTLWATDTNYTTGPLSGQPTKLALVNVDPDEGWVPFETPGAQEFNFLWNEWTSWLDWARDGSSAGAADAHIVETDANGATTLRALTVLGSAAATAVNVTGGSSGLAAIVVDAGTVSSGDGVRSTATGTGAGLRGRSPSGGGGQGVRADATSVTGVALRCESVGGATADTVEVVAHNAGHGIDITHDGAADAIHATCSAAGDGLHVEHSSSGAGVQVTHSGTGHGLHVIKSATTGHACFLDASTATSGTGLTVNAPNSTASTDPGIKVQMTATGGTGIRVDSNAGAVSGQAVFIVASGGCSGFTSAAVNAPAGQMLCSGTGSAIFARNTGGGLGTRVTTVCPNTGSHVAMTPVSADPTTSTDVQLYARTIGSVNRLAVNYTGTNREIVHASTNGFISAESSAAMESGTFNEDAGFSAIGSTTFSFQSPPQAIITVRFVVEFRYRVVVNGGTGTTADIRISDTTSAAVMKSVNLENTTTWRTGRVYGVYLLPAAGARTFNVEARLNGAVAPGSPDVLEIDNLYARVWVY